MRVLSGDGTVEGWRGERREKTAEKRKGKERIPSSGSRKGCE